VVGTWKALDSRLDPEACFSGLGLCNVPRSLRADAEMLGHDRFLPFLFIIDCSPYNSTLCSLDVDFK
jgi:hypothetical protein